MRWGLIITVGLALFALGCTQGAPTISVTEDLPPIILDQANFSSKNIELFDMGLVGRVTKFINILEISFDGGSSWTPLENGAQASLQIDLSSCTVNCPFTYSLQNIGQRWPMLMALPYEGEARGLLRGSGVYGTTTPTEFFVKRLKRGFISIGSLGLNKIGGKVKTIGSGLRVVSGRIESRPVKTLGTTGIRAQGVIQ